MKFRCLIILLLFIFTTDLLAEPRFARTSDGRQLMQSGCSEAAAHLSSLVQWTSETENRTCTQPSVVSRAEGMCAYDVSECLPQMVRQYAGLGAAQDGPNCWNTALVMRGLIPALRQTSSEEFEFFIRSPLCHEVSDETERQPGDIGTIEVVRNDGSVRHVHAFIHVSDQMIYNKIGLNATAGFAMQSYNEMHETYPLQRDGECYYHCEPNKPMIDFIPYVERQQLIANHPEFRLPEAESLCNALRENPDMEQQILRMFLTESMLGFSLNDPLQIETQMPVVAPKDASVEEVFQLRGQTETVQTPIDMPALIRTACVSYDHHIANINDPNTPCSACAVPRRRFYRCDRPEEYLSRFSDRSSEFYKALNETLTPIECSLQQNVVNNRDNAERVRTMLIDGMDIIGNYLRQEVRDINSLTEQERWALASIGTRLEEMEYSINMRGERPESDLSNLYDLSRSYIQR